MTQTLDEFLSTHSLLPWQYGQEDCLMNLANWAVARAYPDPAAHLRNTYNTEEGYKAIILSKGSTIALVDDCAKRSGIVPSEFIRNGYIGVIGSHENNFKQWGAIYSEGWWWVRDTDGYHKLRARPLAVWRI